jgi:hypothetical protein
VLPVRHRSRRHGSGLVGEAIAVFRHLRDLGVIEQRRALLTGGCYQVDQQAVVELAVE